MDEEAMPGRSRASMSEGSRETFTQSELSEMRERMSNEANKQVRERYRTLLIDQQEKVDRAGEPGVAVEELKSMVCLANEEVSKVMRPREAALDAEYLKTCGQLMKATIERRQFNTTEFHPAEFSLKYIRFTQLEEDGADDLLDTPYWRRLGKASAALYKIAPPIESIYPGIDFEKPKKERLQKRRVEEKVAAKVVPTMVKEATNDEERQTSELTRISNILKKNFKENNKKPLCFFRFAVNPNSYSYTVENIFHISFLVNLLRAEILEDEDGLPVICPREEQTERSPQIENAQCVFSLSTEEFQEVVKNFNIREASIPPASDARKRKSEVD
ncbi:uncharacterized protein Nse4 [Palaemon carinicauda]|uniref:uncharacterized protein Nse4 n=1 Tax=Palaemon carinicauda TaxID=392227 RepID=UPI0035B5FC65